MSFWSAIRSRPRSTLVDAAVLAGVAGMAIYRLRGITAERRSRKAAAAETINTWEGEGGNVVSPQPSDPTLAEPPAALPPMQG